MTRDQNGAPCEQEKQKTISAYFSTRSRWAMELLEIFESPVPDQLLQVVQRELAQIRQRLYSGSGANSSRPGSPQPGLPDSCDVARLEE